MNIQLLNKFTWFCFTCFTITCTLSCNNSSGRLYHPEYFDAILKHYDSVHDATYMADTGYLQNAYRRFAHPGAGDLAEKYTRLSAFYTDELRDLAWANLYCDSGIQILKPLIKTNQQLAQLSTLLYFQKAFVYFKYKKFDESIILYNIGKQQLGADSGNCIMRRYYEGVANLFYNQERYKDAIINFKKHYEFSDSCLKSFDRFVYMQGNLDNVGMAYYKLNRQDSALYYYNAALDYIQKEEHLFPANKNFVTTAKMVVYRNISELYFKFNNFKLAEQYAKIGIDSMGVYAKDLVVGFKILLLEHYINEKKQREAKAIIQQLDREPTEYFIFNNAYLDYYRLKAQYYLITNDTGKAYKSFAQLNYLKDSVDRRVRSIAPLDMKKEFEFAQEKLINQNLQKDNQLKKSYLWLAFCIIFLIVFVVIVIGYNLRRSKKHIVELEQLNNQVFTQNHELEQTLISLEQSHSENSKIMRVIAHDLKNPLSGIKMVTRKLSEKESDIEKKEMLEIVANTCADFLGMVNDLIDGRKNLSAIKKEILDLSKLLKDSISLMQAKADEKKQQLLLYEQPVIVAANRQMIWRVFSNIITNAIKFSPENAVIKINLKQYDNWARISIQDKGIGIPRRLQDKIFQIDKEKSRPGTNGERSYGLGLVISKRIVEDHQGKLWFISEESAGSTFFIELPVKNGTDISAYEDKMMDIE